MGGTWPRWRLRHKKMEFEAGIDVQPAPGVDLEGLDVARECLEEVFKINLSSNDNETRPVALVDLFSSREVGAQLKDKTILDPSTKEKTSCTTSSSERMEGFIDFKALNAEDQAGASRVLGGDFKDELLGNFFTALDRINFFKTLPDAVEDPAQLSKATQFFNDALMEMENSEEQLINISGLAEMFKLRGNRFMQSKSYAEAIDLYTFAIALCERNAVYYCNRAAAYTQVHRYDEAIQDCLKSIEINPSYGKAYSRLGHAYYARGDYSDALNKGFLKALQLDPNSDSVKENIRVAHQKLVEERQQAAQNMGSNQGQASTQPSSSDGAQFASFSFDSSTPPDFQSAWSSSQSGPSSFFSFNPPIPPTPSGLPDMFRAGTQLCHFPTMLRPPGFDNMFNAAAAQAAGSTSGGTTFPSFSFGASTPAQFADVFRTMVREGRPGGASEGGGTEPEVRLNGNFSFDFGESPEQVSDVLRSVMGMFPQRGSQHDVHRDSS